MSITGDDQWEWRGFKVGDGTAYPSVKWDPGAPSVGRNPMDRPGFHGTILPRTDLLRARAPSLEIEVEGSTRADLQTKLDALDAASIPLSTGDEALDFQILGTPRRMYVRPSPARWLWTVDSDIGLLVQNVLIEFYAQDPRIYAGSATVTVLS